MVRESISLSVADSLSWEVRGAEATSRAGIL